MFGSKARRIRELESDADEMRSLIIEQSLVITSLRKQVKVLQERLNPEPKVPEPTPLVHKGSRTVLPKRQDEAPVRRQEDTSYMAPAIVASTFDSSSSYSSCDSGSSGGGDSGGSCGGGGGD